MTCDEAAINAAWPAIRETVGRALPVIDALGWGDVLRSWEVPRQIEFWTTWRDMDERPMLEITAVAQMVKRERSQ